MEEEIFINEQIVRSVNTDHIIETNTQDDHHQALIER